MSEKPELDKGTYEAARDYLREASKHMAEAGHQLRDLSEFALERFGDEFLPYIEQFYNDIQEGKINLDELNHTIKSAFFGEPISPAEREQRIREAAYLHAEKRGFVSGSDIDDWLYAEKLVDEQLAQQAGLVSRGGERIASIATALEKEFADIGQAILEWTGKPPQAAGKTTVIKKKAPVRKAPAVKANAAQDTKPAAVNKKAVAKKAVKKKASNKKAAKKT